MLSLMKTVQSNIKILIALKQGKIVNELETVGALNKVEENIHTVPYGDRSGEVVEPAYRSMVCKCKKIVFKCNR